MSPPRAWCLRPKGMSHRTTSIELLRNGKAGVDVHAVSRTLDKEEHGCRVNVRTFDPSLVDADAADHPRLLQIG